MLTPIKLIVLCLTLISLGACAIGGEIQAVPSENQRVFYKDGRELLLSRKKNSIAGVLAGDTHIIFGKRADFFVTAKNDSNKDVVFSTENISAFSSGVPLKVYSYEDLRSEEETRQALALFSSSMKGVSDSIEASRAGYSDTYGTYSGTVYANGVPSQSFGSYSGTTYNPAAAQAAKNAAQADSEVRFATIEHEGQARSSFLDQTALKKETLFPQKWGGGFVKIDMPKATEDRQDITLVIDVAGDEHRFTLALKKKNEN